MKTNRFFLLVFSIMLMVLFVINGYQGSLVNAQTISNDEQNYLLKFDDPIHMDLNLSLNPATLDPSFETDANALTVIEQLFIGLLDTDDETGEVIPELATSWVFSNGNTVIDFTLRNDVYWSDGNKVTAQDVEYGILRAMAPINGYPYPYVYSSILNAIDYHDGNITDPNLVGVDALSETQLRITLAYPATEILSVLSMSFMRPLPSWAIDTWGGLWTLPGNIVTNGAYKLSEWVADDHLLLVKNPTYYNVANVQIEEINLVIADADTAWTLYVNDELDSVEMPSSALPETIHQSEIVRKSVGCTYYYGFNTDLPPFDNVLVRKAFIAATKRSDVTAYTQSGFPALTFTPQGVVGYVDGYYEDIGIPYDPTKAQDWLAAAGYPNGIGLPPITLWFNDYTGHQDIANIIHESWLNELGVNVNLQSVTWEDYLTQLGNGDYQVWRLGWCMDYPDAQDFLYEAIIQRLTSYGNWNNPTYNSLLEAASSTTDQNLRNTLFKQAEEILVETDAVMLPLYHYGVDVATKAYLQRTFGSVQPDYENWRNTTITQSIPVASGGTVTSYDGRVLIQVDAGDFSDDVIITLTPSTGMSPQSILAGNGLVFELTAEYLDGSPAEISPGQTVLVQVSYSDDDIRTIEEETLALYYWDGAAWVKETSSLVDSVNNTITATLDHFSLWALFGETNRVFIPLLSK